MKVFKPEVFQGSLNKKKYFEGWYFKHVSKDLSSVYAFIPGISLTEDDPHAFIQVINGITGKTAYVSYPMESFSFKRDRLFVKVGDSLFCEDYIDLNIDHSDIKVSGRLDYEGLSKYPKSLMAPGIMGWYSFVPFMECYHGVVSANHIIKGKLEINKKDVDFNLGKGYIEKDWGISFPECWIWLQSNSFKAESASVFVSVAKIPWMGKFFMGFIAFVYLDGKYYKFSTYNGSKISQLKQNESGLHIEMENRKYYLNVSAKINKAGALIAPEKGNMSRRIKESIDSELIVSLRDKNQKVIFSEETKRAGLEIIEEIFEYF